MSNSITLAPSHDDPRLAYLIDQQSLFLLVVIFGGMLVLLVLEQLWPRRHSMSVPVGHWLTNWFLASINFFVLFWLTLQLGNWALLRSYFPDPGLYERLQPLVAIALIVVLVEFASYWIHRLFHRVSGLWRLHAVHHTDTTFDVTTSQRHHTAEVAIDTIILLPIFLLFGAPTLILVFYQLVRVLLVLFNHSNIYLLAGLDRVLRNIIVTPDFHRLHHSPDPQFTNSNYQTGGHATILGKRHFHRSPCLPAPRAQSAWRARFKQHRRRGDRIHLGNQTSELSHYSRLPESLILGAASPHT